VAANYIDGQLHVFLNNGAGAFRDSGSYAADTSAMASPIWLVSGDVNGDGKMDVVSSNYGSGSLTFLAGNGDGTLQQARTITQLMRSATLDLGDLNFDGKLDLVAIPDNVPIIAVYLGSGDGTFAAAAPLTVTAGSGQGVRVADVNGDGIPDVIGICAFSSPARVFLGAGDGTFLAERLFPGGAANPFNSAVADWNQDGLMDLALSEGSDRKISILLNTTVR
jgi:hypothetical protein